METHTFHLLTTKTLAMTLLCLVVKFGYKMYHYYLLQKTLFLKPFSRIYFLDFSHVECSIIEHKIIINLLGAHNIKSKRWSLLCETNVFHIVEPKHGLNGLD